MTRISSALLTLALTGVVGTAQAITYTGSGSAWSSYTNYEGTQIPGISYCVGQHCVAENSKWGSTASLDASLSPGLITVDMLSTGWGDGYSSVNYRGYFDDSFSVLSDSLAPGSLVTLRYTVRFDVVSTGTSGPNPTYTVSLGPSLDCCHLIFNQWYSAGGNMIPAGGTVTAFQQVGVGSVHNLTGQLAAATGRIHSDPGTSTINGSVHFYVDVLEAGAYLQAASGHNYSLSAPVPEPTTWVLMLAGLAGMASLGKVRNASSRFC